MADSTKTKTLFVFDFDFTLVDDNTDTWIMSLCPELQLKENLQSLRKIYSVWTQLMDHVFTLIHKQGCSRDDIQQHMKKLQLYDEAMKAVNFVHECSLADSIILSNSNSVFIDLIIVACDIRHMFVAVLTNPAHFESGDRLTVKEYCSHNCRLCKSPNLCKSLVLKEYLQSHPDYKKVVYVGDGSGDYCPALSLTKDDVVICREGFGLARLLSSSELCQAKVVVIDFVKSLSKSVQENL